LDTVFPVKRLEAFAETHTHHVSGEIGCEGGWCAPERRVEDHQKDGRWPQILLL